MSTSIFRHLFEVQLKLQSVTLTPGCEWGTMCVIVENCFFNMGMLDPQRNCSVLNVHIDVPNVERV